MKCTNCGKDLSEGVKFCTECGTPVPKKRFCINCGIQLVPEAKFCPECGTKQQEENTVKDQESEVARLEEELREKINKEADEYAKVLGVEIDNSNRIKKADIDISKIKRSGLWLIKLDNRAYGHYHIFQITKCPAEKKITLVKMVKEIGCIGLAEAKQYVEGANSDNPLTIVVSYVDQVKEFCTSNCEYNYVNLGSDSKISFLDNSISVNNDVAIFKANPAKKSMRVSHNICDYDYIEF